MKSKRAKQYLLKVITPIAMMYPDCPEECDLKLREAKRAVELAEQEAEERMRDEAIKVYCLGCACYENGECIAEPDKCDARNEFIKAINKI
jgi:hypothetical protein